VIIWLNGTFGAGKTTTSKVLAETLPARLFDSEHIGYLLRPIIGDIPCKDFKEWPPWRGLTIETARQVYAFTGDRIVIPQTVLQYDIWCELRDGFAAHEVPMRAFTLHAEREVWAERVANDEVEAGAEGWRHEHRPVYEDEALSWLERETVLIDNTGLTPEATAARIAAELSA
jgi:hypothetical protein